jgi:hypothetical protein
MMKADDSSKTKKFQSILFISGKHLKTNRFYSNHHPEQT